MMEQVVQYHALTAGERRELDNLCVALQPNRIYEPSDKRAFMPHLHGHEASRKLCKPLQQPHERVDFVFRYEGVLPRYFTHAVYHGLGHQRLVPRQESVRRLPNETGGESIQRFGRAPEGARGQATGGAAGNRALEVEATPVERHGPVQRVPHCGGATETLVKSLGLMSTAVGIGKVLLALE